MSRAAYDAGTVSQRKRKEPKMGPYLKSALWVQEIVKHHGVSQEKFAEMADMSRGGLAKLYYGYQRPRFDSLEKLKAVAPPFLKDFEQWVRGDHAAAETENRETDKTSLYVVKTRDAAIVAQELDDIGDNVVRRRARNAALKAIEAALHTDVHAVE